MNKKGFAIITVLIIMMIFFILATVFSVMSSIEARKVFNLNLRERAFYSADSGIEYMLSMLTNSFGEGPYDNITVFTDKGLTGRFSVRKTSGPTTITPANPEYTFSGYTWTIKYEIQSIGEIINANSELIAKRTLKATMLLESDPAPSGSGSTLQSGTKGIIYEWKEVFN